MFSQAAFPFGWHWAAAFSTAHRRDLLELLQKARTRGGIYSERGEIFEVMHDSVHSTAISLFMSTLTKYFDHPCMCPPPHLLEPFYPCFVSLSPFPSSSSFTALFFCYHQLAFREPNLAPDCCPSSSSLCEPRAPRLDIGNTCSVCTALQGGGGLCQGWCCKGGLHCEPGVMPDPRQAAERLHPPVLSTGSRLAW